MVKSEKRLRAFEKTQVRKERLSYTKALRIFEALYKEARNLGILPGPNPLEGIETDIRLAKILNSRRCSKGC